MYSKWLNIYIWPIDNIQTSINPPPPSPSRPGSNDNEGVLQISQISTTEALPSDSLVSYQGHFWVAESYSIAKIQSASRQNNWYNLSIIQLKLFER